MNILLSIPGSKLPVTEYGGTQRVVWYLANELHRMGHRVWLLAAPGTVCPFAEVIERNSEVPLAEQIPECIDIIHCQDRVDESIRHLPHIVTMNGNKCRDAMDANTVFVSRNHAERFGGECFVYNGLDWDDYGPVDMQRARSYYHFLGKAAWRVKNVRGAISVAKALPGARLEVLGGYRFNFKMGLRFTFSPKIRFEGMVGGERKNKWLAGSRGLIFPVVWDEPFGLVVTESLYFGAPVFATPYGSLPELVTPEVGFLTDSKAEMVSHIASHYDYSPKVCHDYAVDRFNSRVMAEQYVKAYERVLDGATLNSGRLIPHTDIVRREWKDD